MTLAIIQSGGKQYKVAPGQKIKVEKLNVKEGDTFLFDKILLIAEERGNSARKDVEVKIGTPYVEGAEVEAKVLKQGRDKKKIVFRYHSKTRYRKKKGHRQRFTEIQIDKILNPIS